MKQSPDTWNAVLQSKEGQAMMEFLRSSGSAVMPQIRQAIEKQDLQQASALLRPLMEGSTAEKLLRDLKDKHA